MLEQGNAAPDSTLIADDGREVSLSDFRGRKVIVYSYPRANTPGCTKQACALRDAYSDIIEGQGAVVIGVSPDRPEALAKFRGGIRPAIHSALRSGSQSSRSLWCVGGKDDVWQGADGHDPQPRWVIGEEGRVMEAKLKVKPLTTADLAVCIVGL